MHLFGGPTNRDSQMALPVGVVDLAPPVGMVELAH